MNYFRTLRLAAFLVLVLVVRPVDAQSESETAVAEAKTSSSMEKDWTQWRGPDRTGTLKGMNWPDSLDESTLVKKWSNAMGPSYSGPIVVGDRVFVTETKDKQKEVVICLDRESGKEIWRKDWMGAMKMPPFARANGDWIRSTPAYSDGKLYVSGILENFVCLDAKDGEIVWSRDCPKESAATRPSFGGVCSPMVDGDFVYLQAANRFTKFKKDTGEIVWETMKGQGNMMSGGFFSSPIISTVAGKRQAVVQSRTTLAGINLEDGAVLWQQEIPSFRGMNILTPTVYKDNVFVSGYRATTQLLNVSNESGSFSVSQKWNLPAQAYMGSPVIVDDHAYIQLGNSLFSCFDLANGKEAWRSNKRFGKYASLIASDDKILALDESGKLLLLGANPEKFELIDQRTVGTDNWAHLAVRGNQVFIRGLRDITMYEWAKKE